MTPGTASTAPSSVLTISYTGDPVRVDPTRIAGDLRVPNVAIDGDDRPGRVADALFCDALAAGALVSPDGMTIECYGDDDSDGAGFTLVAHANDNERRGVTCGWRDAGNIARLVDDDRRDSDPDIARRALEYFAAELNAALGANTVGETS
jgi:hypothetical protein